MIGLLVTSHGAPSNFEEMVEMFTRIRGGKRPGEEEARELARRYEAISWNSPLNAVTERQGQAIARELAALTGEEIRLCVGFKNVDPSLEQAAGAIKASGVSHAAVAVMSPYFTCPGAADYLNRARQALSFLPRHRVFMVGSFFDAPPFVEFFSKGIAQALRERKDAAVIFTAHSLPLLHSNFGEYDRDRRRFAEAVISSIKRRPQTVRLCYQSVGMRGGKWLGPDVLSVLRELAGEVDSVVVAADGFVTEHLEVLYDLDVEAKALANSMGLDFVRIPLPGADEALAKAIARRIAGGLFGK